MTVNERYDLLDELESEAKSWEASKLIPWKKDYLDGGGVVICYDNGYCADICITNMSYGNTFGLFELAILEYKDGKIGEIVYDTPITNDVLGCLSIEECKYYCNKIKQLPMRN